MSGKSKSKNSGKPAQRAPPAEVHVEPPQEASEESAQDVCLPARNISLNSELAQKAFARHALTSLLNLKWLLRPTDPTGANLWPAVIDFILALHDVLTLSESSQAEFLQLGASVGTLAEMVILDLLRDTKAAEKWHPRFIDVLDVLKSVATQADGMKPHLLLKVFTDALLERMPAAVLLIPVLNPYMTVVHPLEAVCIFAGIAKQAKGQAATLKHVYTNVNRVARAFEPIHAGTTKALQAGFAIACATGVLFDRLGVTSDTDRREIAIAANALIADLSDDDRSVAWRGLCRVIDMRNTTKMGIATPAGPAFGTMAVSSTRSANPVAAVVAVAAPAPVRCMFCGYTGHTIDVCRKAMKAAEKNRRKKDDNNRTCTSVKTKTTPSVYMVGSTIDIAGSRLTQRAASVSVSIQTLDDAGNPAHSLDVAALSDTGSNWTYINAATWRALGQPQLADADDQGAPLHDVNGAPVRAARRLVAPIHIAVRNSNMGLTAYGVRLLPDMPVALLIGRAHLLDPSAHTPPPTPDASGVIDLLRFRWVPERQALQMALSNGNWFDVGTPTPALVAAAAPLHLSDPHAATAGMRAVAQAGAKALRDKSAAPSAPPPVQPLDIPELTYESDADYRREFHKKHAGDHRDIKLPADIPADVAEQLRGTFQKHAMAFANKSDPPPISKIAPLVWGRGHRCTKSIYVGES
jgi:hypothetical protein